MSPNRPPQGDVPPMGGGLPPPRQLDQAYRGGPPAVISPQTPGTLRASLLLLTAQNTGFNGAFMYSPEVGAGNLVFSLAPVAGTDPWGNTYPAGVSLLTPGSVIQGNDYILNTSGLFFYNGSPQAGNLIMSLAAQAGTDTFGNAYPQGLSVGAVPVGTGAIGGTNIAPGTIGSNAIGAGAIVAGAIAAGAIDGMVLNNVTINGQTISGANVEVSAGAGGVFAYGSPPGVTKTYTAAGAGTFVVPSGVTSLTLQTWGAGGGGSDENTDHSGGAGAGGGARSTATLAVTGGQTVYYSVGAAGAAGSGGSGSDGGQSWVNTSNTPTGAVCAAGGGQGGQAGSSGGTGGTGGTVLAGTGYAGGAGAAGAAVAETTSYQSAGSTGHFSVPNGVYAVTVKTWGGGGGAAGGGTAGGANSGGYGGGAGAFAETTSYTVAPGDSLAYQVGMYGNGGAANSLGTNGTPSWLKDAGGSYIAYADYGRAATTDSAAPGGKASNSTGTTTYSGGNGGTASGSGGSGGGGSGGLTGPGGNGQSVTGSTGGAGGAAGQGGGQTGGNGGNSDKTGDQGGAPGAGGGGGGGGSSAGSGAIGRRGEVDVTVSIPQAGGGGSSGGTSSAGNAGSLRAGGAAVSGGGPGGGTYMSLSWTAAPSTGPGGGGGGYDSNGAAAAGADGQVVISYTAGTPVIEAAFTGGTGTDPQASKAFGPGLNLYPQTSAPSAVSGAALLYGDANTNASRLLSSGYAAPLSDGQSDVTSTTVTASSLTALSKAWTIPANDAQIGTTYRITAWGTGTWGSTAQQANFCLSLNGGNTSQNGVASGSFATNESINWIWRCEFTVTATGASGSAIFGQSAACSSNSAGSTGAGGVNPLRCGSASIDTTASNTLGLGFFWASTTGSPTITCLGSVLERLGS